MTVGYNHAQHLISPLRQEIGRIKTYVDVGQSFVGYGPVVALTPKKLRELAAAEDDIARLATVRAELYRRTADELEATLTATEPAVRVGRMQEISKDENGLRGSASAAATAARPNPFLHHLNGKGYSLRRLARELSLNHTSVSHWSTGRHAIPRATADAIERAVGYAASLANWPGGIRG